MKINVSVKEQVQFVTLGQSQAAATAVSRTSPSGLHCDIPSGQGHPVRTPWRHRQSSKDNKCPKRMYEGFLVSHAPKHECMHLCCMHRIRRQSISCPPIHSPLHQLSGSQIYARQHQASCGATVNCRMSIVYSNRSTGDWPRFFIHRSPQPAVHQTVASR